MPACETHTHQGLHLPQAAPVLCHADDAVGDGFAVPPHLLQALPGFDVDLHLRGVARLKNGDNAGGEADISEARMIDPKVSG
jgi:hypothetical protein